LARPKSYQGSHQGHQDLTTLEENFLPYGRQLIDEDDIAAVTEVLRSDWLTTGPTVDQFEKAFGNRTGAKHAVSCSSGTAALHLTAMALGIGAGDTVIVPSITFLASANAFKLAGANIVFADVDPHNGLMTEQTFVEALDRTSTQNVRAVIIVHLGGQCPDMTAIAEIATDRNILVIEDACHALGTKYLPTQENRKPTEIGACQHSTAAVFSMHPVKTMTMGEGGVITTNDPEVAAKCRLFRNHGMHSRPDEFVNKDLAFGPSGTANVWYYEMSEIGLNYRVSDINCALGLSQLKKLDHFVAERRRLARLYDDLLSPLAPTVESVTKTPFCDPAPHLYSVLINFDAIGFSRAEFMRQLHQNGIGTQVHYIPVHRQPYYRALAPDTRLPGADSYYAACLSLPLFPAMEDADVERVVTEFRKLISRNNTP
jgi:UDP-4-amino-4,6-dideoxy-N-acetyl-beta-L-altrosamine transaminase